MKSFFTQFLIYSIFITSISAQNCGVISQAFITNTTLTIVVQSTSGGSKSVRVNVICGATNTTIVNNQCLQSNATNTYYTYSIGSCPPASITMSYTDHSNAACGGTNCSNGVPVVVPITPLPVTFSNVSITAKNKTTAIVWNTYLETNNDYFTIERSADGRSFDAVGEIKGAGNSQTNLAYEYTDVKPYAGINFYRIKQTDYDGKYSYSDIKSVRHNTVGNLNITPRTTEGRLQVTTDIEAYSLDVYNVAGQQVKSFKSLSKDQYISIDDLTTGLYFIKINHDGQVETTKIVKI